MTMFRKKGVRVFLTLILIALIYLVYYCWRAFPIATGYGAKILCSGLYVSGREEADIIAQELNFFPVKYASFEVNQLDSSVTASLFGMARQKAIFRKGLGATLVRGISEEALRAQQFIIPLPPANITDSTPWPIGNAITGSFPAAIDSAGLVSAVDAVFNQSDSPKVNITRALIVLYDGRIVAERYGKGITSNTKLGGWSMTKSITSALTGIAVQQGRLSVDAVAPVDEWKTAGDRRHGITLKNLLQQTSGLDFTEVYDKPADANSMLYKEADAGRFTALHPLLTDPGSKFRYSSGNTNIISRILRKNMGDKLYHAFPYEQLFYKIGMLNTVMEPDPSGTFVGSSYCYATARDWARFGLLYYNRGNLNGEQIISADWIRQSIEPTAAAEQGEYGYQWWLNAGQKGKPANRKYPEMPEDSFWADGFEGQNVFVIPSKKLVIVRLGMTRIPEWGERKFVQAVIAAER